jgi:hypothetical protein
LEGETPPNSNVLFPVVFENEASTPLKKHFLQSTKAVIGWIAIELDSDLEVALFTHCAAYFTHNCANRQRSAREIVP